VKIIESNEDNTEEDSDFTENSGNCVRESDSLQPDVSLYTVDSVATTADECKASCLQDSTCAAAVFRSASTTCAKWQEDPAASYVGDGTADV